MKLSINSLKPQDFFNEFFWKNEVKNGDEFAKAVQIYTQDLQANLNQSEKAIVANVLKPFFQSLGFTAVSEKAQNAVSTQSAIDLVLEKDGEPLVIIEAKKHGSSDFISEFEANKKALQECILYYFRERENGNSSLKNIIIADFYSFYIFRASEFEELFYKNKELEKLYKNFTNPSSFYKGNTDEFYKDCEKILNSENFLNKLKNKSGSLFDENIESEAKPQIKALHFDIRNFDATKEQKSKAFYKAFSKDFLLGEFSYDPNKISKKFYDELLYILGLKEQQGGSLQPNGAAGSLYENIFARLSTPSFETAMQLIILWLNRILFLKLIETNLLNFNKNSVGGGLDDYKNLKFLNISKIPDFDTLHELFFNILAKPLSDLHRSGSKFAYLPYLNSSIFTKQEIEKTLEINQLENGVTIQIYAHTSLFDEKHKKLTGEMPFLQYLFEFLDSFDFGENHSDENKSDLISSAVLGQVFERLNGYKDGSFYTPSFITSYMSKASIDKLVLAKFSEFFGVNLANLDDLEDEINAQIRKSQNRSEIYKALNSLIDSLKICDPAVGSGYFLVSALNYIIFLKSKLGILIDENAKPLKVEISYKFDELIVCEYDGSIIRYSRPTSQTDPRQIIQKTLFNEKAKLIENCLFGVDINPNSCEIARLRLWIELLKSSYFTDLSEPNPLKQNALETLPNIDINIKCGNSLISLFALNDTFDKTNINLKSKIKEYKEAVKDYKEGSKKSLSKSDLKEKINELKRDFFAELKDPRNKRKLENALKNHINKFGNELLKSEFFKYVSDKSLKQGKFSFDNPTEEAKKSASNIAQLSYELEINLSVSKLYENSMEWRFEFPEILDENGDFVGFDLIIANPPYIRQEAIKEQKEALKNKFKIFCSTADIYTYFFELGFNVLKNGGILSFITSNKFFRAGYGQNLREFMLKNAQIQSITDLNGLKVFDSAIVDTAVTILQKQKPQKNDTFAFSNPKIKDFKSAEIFQISQNSLSAQSFTFLNPIEANLKAKIERLGTPLKDWDINIYRGILTGLNEAFIIDEATRTEILDNCESSDERKCIEAIIKPILRGRDIKRYYYEWAKIYLINFHNGYTCADGVKIPPLDIADFPSLKKHFDKFEPALSKRTDKGKTPYNLRNCAYLEEFEKEKIVYPCIQAKEPSFVYDDKKFYSPAPANIISGNGNIVKILTSLLNSKFIYAIMRKFYMGGGIEGEFKTNNLEKLPIPKISKEKEAEFVNLVDKILKETDENERAKLSGEIDKLVYQIYDLTSDEIALIENA